jgi:Family of unknown function (DUF6289)
MAGKAARLALAATLVTGLTMAACALPASAAARPGVAPGEEILLTYYNNAQHSTVVGQYAYGCTFSSWGESTSYYVTTAHAC